MRFSVRARFWLAPLVLAWVLGPAAHASVQSELAFHRGVIAYGDQRGAAVADYNADGRLDLIIGQNGAPTQLWENTGAHPGLRVRLQGPALNPHAVGAQVWRTDAGPVHTVTAGTGYWSGAGPVLVLARPTLATTLTVRWPDGTIITVPLAPDQAEITVPWEPT